MKKKTDIDIFFEYLNTAEIVYKDNICITDMNTLKHRYDMLPSDINDVIINPNHTFTVYFDNGDSNIFELYTKHGHYHSVNNPNIDKIIKHSQKEAI